MNGRRTLFAVGSFLAISALAWLLTAFLRPETTAHAGECIRRIEGALTNLCEKPVNVSLCRKTGQSGNPDDPCVRQTLAPYETFTARLDTPSTGTPYTLACHAPFEPVWRRSNSNYNLFNRGCRKPSKTSGQTVPTG